MSAMARVAGVPAASTERRPTVGGRYLYADGRKLYVRGVTYGPFAPDAVTGETVRPASWSSATSRRWPRTASTPCASTRCRRAGCSTPPGATACCVMVGLPWEQHVAFLDDRGARPVDRAPRARGRPRLRRASGRALLRDRQRDPGVDRALARRAAGSSASSSGSTDAVKDEDPGGARHLRQLPDDRVPRPAVPRLRLLQRLPRVDQERLDGLPGPAAEPRRRPAAGAWPRSASTAGATARRRRPRCSTGRCGRRSPRGCAGAFVFAWTDEWHRGGHDIEDWDFGLTDARAPAQAGAGRGAARPSPRCRSRAGVAWPRGLGRGLQLQRRAHDRATACEGAGRSSTTRTTR